MRHSVARLLDPYSRGLGGLSRAGDPLSRAAAQPRPAEKTASCAWPCDAEIPQVDPTRGLDPRRAHPRAAVQGRAPISGSRPQARAAALGPPTPTSPLASARPPATTRGSPYPAGLPGHWRGGHRGTSPRSSPFSAARRERKGEARGAPATGVEGDGPIQTLRALGRGVKDPGRSENFGPLSHSCPALDVGER